MIGILQDQTTATMLRIGTHVLPAPAVLAPMAGVTDRPFRQLCRRLGASLAVHGRTRADGYHGLVEYDTIRAIGSAVTIPLFANGDIDSPEQARRVLAHTGADGVMIGRAAQGRPWIFREINHYLATGRRLPEPTVAEVREWLLGHLDALYDFYGEAQGVRVARKHLQWYSRGRPEAASFWQRVNRVDAAREQFALTREFLDRMTEERLAA